jgi:hypothetical protein
MSKEAADTFLLGHRRVNRLGYGAMQLAGPGVFGPPKDRKAASLCCAKLSNAASIISTRAISTAVPVVNSIVLAVERESRDAGTRG